MKTILSILFLFTFVFAHAQYHNVEGIRVVDRNDSTTISNVGQIQFDADDDKFRFNDGNGWYSFLKDDATLPYWPLTGSVTLTGTVSIFGSNEILNLGIPTINPLESFSVHTEGPNRLGMNTTIGFDIVSSVGFRITDNSAIPLGFIYAADYSSTFTNRSLVDKAYVDGKFDGIQVPEGTNKTMGIATLSSGTVTVNTTAVTANSRIFLTVNGGTLTNVGTPYVSARSAGTSFTITSTDASDASDVAWLIIEPAP